MKNLLNLFGLFIVLSLVTFGCKKDEVLVNETFTPIEINPPVINVNADVYGKVVNQNDDVLSEVDVNLNGVAVQTDENGFFKFRNVTVNSYGNVISVDEAGYYKAIKLVETTNDGSAYIEFKLMNKTLRETVASSSASEVMITGVSKVEFQADGFIDSTGEPYSGDVNIYAEWLDPTALTTLQVMPGDLRAVDSESDIVQLATYGMLAVELESPTGELLNLAEGMEAELTFEVPAELQNNAPATIPMWYFDDASGYWVEQGEATLQDGKYVGMVSHFSFWNCDAPFPLVNMHGLISDTRGYGLSNLLVEIIMNSGAAVGTGWTDADGFYYGKIPANEVLTIKVYDSCGELVFEGEIGPFTTDVTIQPIEIVDNLNNILFTGIFHDCDGNPVVDSYVKVGSGDFAQYIFVEDDGSFSGVINVCDLAEVNVIGIDIANAAQTTPYVATIDGNDVEVGVISACDELEEYFYYTLGTEFVSMTEVYFQDGSDPNGEIEENYYYMSGSGGVDAIPTIGIVIDNGPDDYIPHYALMFTNNQQYAGICQDELCNDFIVTFIQMPTESGETVKATFTGLIDVNGVDTQIDGAFKTTLF